MNRILLLLLLFTNANANMHAQDKQINKTTDSTKQLSDVIVTATRTSTQLLSIPYSVNTINRKQIDEFQFRSTPEALTGLAGVFVQKTNHGGGSPFVRGLTGNQTLLLVDGIRFNNATFRFGPNQYLNTIDVNTIAKLEVARGTGSVQYGSDALGGVVQVFTKEPVFADKKIIHATAIGRAATHDMEYTGRGEVHYQSKKIAFLVGYSNKNFGDLVGGDTTGKQTPSGYTEQAFDAKLKWKIAANATLTAAHQFLQQKNVPLYHRVKLENFAYYFFAPQQRQMTYAKLEVDGKSNILNKLVLATSLQQSLEKRSYQKNGNAYKFLEEDKVRTIGITADIFSLVGKHWTANTGVEFYNDKVNSFKQQTIIAINETINQRGLYPNNASSGNFSLYSLHHIKINRFEVQAGLRYNSFTINIPDTVTSSLKLGDITVKPTSVVTNLAVVYRIKENQSIYASFSTGYRTPNIDDMGSLGLVDFRYEIPAYNLKPEKTYNIEIGYRFINKKINASVAFFHMHLANLITRVQVPNEQVGGYNVYTKQNSQQAFVRGVEGSFNYSISKSFNVQTVVSYALGQNISANEPMRRIPPLNGKLLLNYQHKKWQASIENLFASHQNRLAKGDMADNRIPLGGTPGWYVVNLYGGFVKSTYAIRLGLQNLLNEDYRTHGSGINGIGRSVTLSIQINL